MKKIKFSLVSIPLLIGISIYLLYRSRNLFYFNFINFLRMNNYIETARTLAIFYRKFFPTWVIYSLPDGLWLFSAGAIFLLCRNKYIFHIFWYCTLSIIIFIFEYFQKIYGGHGTSIGTFDKNDLLAYFCATVSIILISVILRKFDNNYKYKKPLSKEIIDNIFYTILILIIGILANLF